MAKRVTFGRGARLCGLAAAILLIVACTAYRSALLPRSTPSATPPDDLYLTTQDVVLYPGPDLYRGDVVTFDVTPRNLGAIPPSDLVVRIYRLTPTGRQEVIAEGGLGYPAFDGVPRARLVWAWDTDGLEGEQHLLVWLDPDDRIHEGDENPANNVVNLTVSLLPATARPSLEVAATWAVTTTRCCILHYLTSTAAERDLATIVPTVEEATAHVQRQLHLRLVQPLDVYLIGRVIGHGGYVQQGLTLSYLDRHYAGSDLETVARHEVAHLLDSLALGQGAPALLREGLAVWAAGGHFKPEPIPERAEALVRIGRYIPLERLVQDFYQQQHEIGYLEGAALVAYLVQARGWGTFEEFYRSLGSCKGTPAEVLDAALTAHYGAGLAVTEQAFLRWLQAHPPTSHQVQDVRLTLYLFDTIRRYQQAYDPEAFFLSGWLPDAAEGARRGMVADFLRHPRTARHIALETMLIAAREALQAGAFNQAEALLDSVNQVLEEGVFASPPAVNYLAVVLALQASGYEAQRVELEGSMARVWAISDGLVLTERTLQCTPAGWAMLD